MTKASQSLMPRRGQAAAAIVARPRFVVFALAGQTPVLAALVGVPGIAAVLEEERALALSLVLPSLGLVAIAVLVRNLPPPGPLRRIEAVAMLAALFILSTLLTAPAFAVLGMTWHDALFEAMSGITSTGMTVAEGAESWPISAHFLRAWTQWCGGLAIAVAGLALFLDGGPAAETLGEQSLGGTDFLASARAKARIVLTGYVLITAIGVLLSIPLFPGWWEGPVITLAAVSTGGFSPRPDSLADYSRAAQVFTMALCVSTSVSLLFYALARQRGLRHAARHGTVDAFLVILCAGTVLNVVATGVVHGWAPERLLDGALNMVSAQTTAGFSVAPIAATGPVLLLLVLAMMLGGDVGSTAGGLKTGRTLLLARMVLLIFLRLRLPDRAVSHLKIGERRADAEAILLAAGLLAIYLVAAGLIWFAFLLAGYPPLASLVDTVSALSTVGHSSGVVGPDLEPVLKGVVIAAMLLGRLEFFAVIILLLPSTWIVRR